MTSRLVYTLHSTYLYPRSWSRALVLHCLLLCSLSLIFWLGEANFLAFWLAHQRGHVVQCDFHDFWFLKKRGFSLTVALTWHCRFPQPHSQSWVKKKIVVIALTDHVTTLMTQSEGKNVWDLVMRTGLWDHCKSLQRNVWCRAVSPLKAVSLDIECRILPWFYEKRRWLMLVLWNCKFLWCDEIYR